MGIAKVLIIANRDPKELESIVNDRIDKFKETYKVKSIQYTVHNPEIMSYHAKPEQRYTAYINFKLRWTD